MLTACVQQLREVFQIIDSDGGGTLDQDELRAAVKDPEVTHSLVRQMTHSLVVQIAKLMMMDPVEIEPILFKILNANGPEEEVTRCCLKMIFRP